MGLLQWMHRLVGGQKDLHLKRSLGNPATSHFIFISIFFLGYCAPDMRRCVIFMVWRPQHFLSAAYISTNSTLFPMAPSEMVVSHTYCTRPPKAEESYECMSYRCMLCLQIMLNTKIYSRSPCLCNRALHTLGRREKKAINPEASLTLPLESKVLFIVKIPSCRP